MSPSKGISGFDTNTDDASPKQRRNRLLLIGIDQYEHWGKLQYPVKDCGQLFQVLKEHYGFGEQDLIQSLYNEQATADIIFDELYRLQESDENGNPRLSSDDNLILYFSGHGHLDKSLDEGYWTPVDAPVPVKNRPSDLRKLVSVSEVVKILSQVKAHHILLIVDACFSGAFARMAVDVMPGGDPNNPEEKPSRWVLTAGRLEPVPDKSKFAEALRNILTENDRPKLSIQTLGAAVKDRVADNGRQTPACISLVEQKYEGGEFFFHRLTAAQRTDQAPRPYAAVTNLPERLRQGSAAHLERLKKGRFKHLNIIQLLLTGNNLPDMIDTQVKSGDTETPLQQAVQSLWGREKPHAVVLGDGGMGKTVSLVRLWEDMLEQQLVIPDGNLPVPVFVALNEYNAIPESEKHDFVLRSIARNCGLTEALTDDWKNALWELLKTPLPDGSSSILLMLDGFNEVTVKKDQLLIDLNRLSELAKGMQMVITSRYVEIQNFTWAQHSEVVELLPLPPDKIEEYLQQVKLPLPEDEALQKLFTNPMMLTLYAGASSIAKKYEHDKRFRFLPTGSYGELLWNFNEAQLARHLEDLEHDPDEQAWHCFLLRCLVPRLAYKMELEGQFFVPTRKALNPSFNFKTLLDEAFTDLNREELTEVFPELDGKRSLLGLGELSDLDAREQRSQKVLKYLVEKLHLLVAEDEALRFVHQNFRDFFAAVHLRNVAEMALVRGELSEEWKMRALPVYLRRMIGEIEGEYRIKQYYDAKTGLFFLQKHKNLISYLIAISRGIFDDKKIGLSTWNILKILIEIRGTLAGENLSSINFVGISLNGIILQGRNVKQYLPVIFSNSLLRADNFFVQGHTSWVVSACYSLDNKKVLSTSFDDTIKVWSVESGKCIQTVIGHQNTVNSACFSPSEHRILSASNDETIKEWSIKSGKCLKTFIGHKSKVNSACYSPSGDRILSASDDETIKEWSVESGECLQTFIGHKGKVNSACYSPSGDRILSASDDKTIKEWSVESGGCLKTFKGHEYHVNKAIYNSDGTLILSASFDGTIKLWKIELGKCIQTFIGHQSWVNSCCFSPDFSKILSSSHDCTIREWFIETGKCLQIFRGHTNYVHTGVYNLNGSKILSSSKDATIKEWSAQTGECLQTFLGYDSMIECARYNPSKSKILTSCWDMTIKEWQVKTGICVQIFKGHKGWVRDAKYSCDEKIIVSSSEDGTVKKWSVRTGSCLHTFFGHRGGIVCVHFHPDGHKILSSSFDETIKEWSLASGTCLKTFIGHTSWVRHAIYNRDGTKVLSACQDGTIKEWSVENNTCLQTYDKHTDVVLSVCYSPKNNKFLSASIDKTIKEWSIEAGKCLKTFVGHKDVVNTACYTKDGCQILSFSSDGTLKKWSIETGECLNTIHIEKFELEGEYIDLENPKWLANSSNKTAELMAESGEILQLYPNESGLYVQSVDFRHLHPDSQFTEEEKDRLRRYGAIFNDEDERRWKEAVADAYGDLEEDDEPENPPHP